MFAGEHYHGLDSKNRIIIPARFREYLGDSFHVCQGYDGCLEVYSSEEWSKICEDAKKLDYNDPQVRNFIRLRFSRAFECQFDKNGRITIPQVLVDLAGLEKECTISGANTHFEIWSKDKWMKLFYESGLSIESVSVNLKRKNDGTL